MAGLFNKKSQKSKLQFVDFEGQALKEGDTVMSMRYELGECRIINTEQGMAYESLSSGQQVSYVKMIDAATGYQKVKRLKT
jgi:hemerythrin-like domain-containing protein